MNSERILFIHQFQLISLYDYQASNCEVLFLLPPLSFVRSRKQLSGFKVFKVIAYICGQKSKSLWNAKHISTIGWDLESPCN